MRVRTQQIPMEGLDVDFRIALDAFRSGLSKTDEAFGLFVKDVDCSIHADLDKKDIFLRGTVQTMIRPLCARCDEPIDFPLEVPIALTCSPQQKGAPGADFHQESDEGLIYYKNEEVNLADIVREQVLLALPMVTLCKPECQGLCDKCGANLNLGEHACPKVALH